MGGNRRKNKAPRTQDRSKTEAWFDNNVQRQRTRNKAARKARRKNRK